MPWRLWSNTSSRRCQSCQQPVQYIKRQHSAQTQQRKSDLKLHPFHRISLPDIVRLRRGHRASPGHGPRGGSVGLGRIGRLQRMGRLGPARPGLREPHRRHHHRHHRLILGTHPGDMLSEHRLGILYVGLCCAMPCRVVGHVVCRVVLRCAVRS